MTPDDILRFWFIEHGPDTWFKKDLKFDASIREHFSSVFDEVLAGTVTWRSTTEGRLAEILVLDQFPRNMFRDSAKAFSGDARALDLAREVVRIGADMEVDATKRQFFYMPYMHSESKEVHEEAVRLFENLGNASALSYEQSHKAVIDQFGRYPHRNSALGRLSTVEEEQFIKTHPGF